MQKLSKKEQINMVTRDLLNGKLISDQKRLRELKKYYDTSSKKSKCMLVEMDLLEGSIRTNKARLASL